MADVVVKLPVRPGEEAELFGSFLTSFMEDYGPRAELWAVNSDAPYLMVRSDPQPDVDLKVLTFQENSVAHDFSQGWAKARVDLAVQLADLLG
jgi:hypothetical protein